jgi:hypothetical protein
LLDVFVLRMLKCTSLVHEHETRVPSKYTLCCEELWIGGRNKLMAGTLLVWLGKLISDNVPRDVHRSSLHAPACSVLPLPDYLQMPRVLLTP